MTTHVAGPKAIDVAALTAHRRAIMDMLVGSEVVTTAEYDTAMQRTLACQDVATLQRWYRNTVREIARREEAAGMEAAPVVEYATMAQKEEIIRLGNNLYILRKEKTAAHLRLPRLNYSEARALIGELWAKILHRQERAAEGMAEASDSFGQAA